MNCFFHKRAGFSLFFSLKSNTLSHSAPPPFSLFCLKQLIEASTGFQAEPRHSPGPAPGPPPRDGGGRGRAPSGLRPKSLVSLSEGTTVLQGRPLLGTVVTPPQTPPVSTAPEPRPSPPLRLGLLSLKVLVWGPLPPPPVCPPN